MKTPHTLVAAAIAATAMLAGCAGSAPQSGAPDYATPYSSSSHTSYYGVVESIRMIPASSADGVGAGAVIGGVVGGLLGNQVGGGSGKTAATVAGAVGGAVVGNQIEQSNRKQGHDRYQISVRLDNGNYQTVEQDSVGDLQVGNRARIENGRAYRY